MKCPNCGLIDNSKVVDSRPYKYTIRRKRKCLDCNGSWFTYEVSEDKFAYYEQRDKGGKYRWSDGENDNLVRFREQFGMTRKEIAEKFGRTEFSIKKQVQVLLENGRYFEILDSLEEVK